MKKISQISWRRYKESPGGKEAISLFEQMVSSNCSLENVLEVVERFNPQIFSALDDKLRRQKLVLLNYFDELLSETLEGREPFQSREEFVQVFEEITHSLAEDLEGGPVDKIPQTSYKAFLGSNALLSMMLYVYMPSFFVPNLFTMQFICLKRIADKYEIELPEVPNRFDYEARWVYYLDICLLFNSFALENSIKGNSELCAFLYDYELPIVREELEQEMSKDVSENPGQAWILSGSYRGREEDLESTFWQASELTERGDICLFYEKSPVKALTSVWIALQNGVTDPFFSYYSNTYIGHKISIPIEYAIRFEDFKASRYFQSRDKRGNFVAKNFQGVGGWPVTSDDYKEICRLLDEKGFDTSVLPKLYEPEKVCDTLISSENDVSEKLLIPLLEQMGWRSEIDFRREVEFNAGRGKTGHSSDKRPDFCMHVLEREGDIVAKVVVEVKKCMKNNREIHDAFVQGRSYAKWGAAQVLVLCDMYQIRVYQRDKNHNFDERKFIKYNWTDMERTDKYTQMKNLLS